MLYDNLYSPELHNMLHEQTEIQPAQERAQHRGLPFDAIRIVQDEARPHTLPH